MKSSVCSLLLLLVAIATLGSVGALFPSSLTRNDRRSLQEQNAGRHGRHLGVDDCPGGWDAAPPFLKFFDELTDEQAVFASRLGYSKKMWDDGSFPEAYKGVKWGELDPMTQYRFEMLGVDEPMYDDHYSMVFWGKLEKINPDLQYYAGVLGYTKVCLLCTS